MSLLAVNVIAVMGVTGSGKSSFIQGITGDGGVKVGNSLRSETCEIQNFRLQTSSGIICLADTPGFDDTERPDFEILEQMVDWVQKSSANGQNLAAILFLHPITHIRLQGSSRRMLSTFKKLLGDDYFKKVLLVTTFWNDVQVDVGERREKELIESDDAWKPMISAGAQVERMERDYKRFIPLLERMARYSAPQLLVHKELIQGKSLEQTMAGMSLDSLHTEQDQRFRDLKVSLDARAADNAIRLPEAVNTQEAAYSLLYEKEIQGQKLANERIIAHMQEEDRRREAIRQHKRQELEEQKEIEREIREAAERERKQEETKRLKEKYELIASFQYQVSRHLQEHACEVTDRIRAYSVTDILPASVKGIQPEGIGIFGEGARGRNENTYSVTRSGLNIWCDACQIPLGAKVQFVCCICRTTYCETCHSIGRGCLRREHTLVRDHSLADPTMRCERLRWPTLSLVCDAGGCHAVIEGFYFHYCYDGRELDFCRNCVLIKGQNCFNDDHFLEWGVRPISLPRFSVENLERQLSADLLQNVVAGNRSWMEAAETPSRLALSTSRYHDIMSERLKVQDAMEKGEVVIKIDLDLPRYCDFCLRAIQNDKHFHCMSEHPETGFAAVALCEACWNTGLSCPSGHDMYVTNGISGKCLRVSGDADKLELICNTCEAQIRGVYFHCCDCNDDYDLCLNCVVLGMGCEDSFTGKHTMKMFYLA